MPSTAMMRKMKRDWLSSINWKGPEGETFKNKIQISVDNKKMPKKVLISKEQAKLSLQKLYENSFDLLDPTRLELPSMGTTQRECYINTIFDSEGLLGIKFGIASDSAKRLAHQNRVNIPQMEQTHVYEFNTYAECRAAENECKSGNNFEVRLLTKEILKDGHTETTSIQNLDKIIEIYERFGGVRIK